MSTPAAALAINGGSPVRASLLPYGRQWVEEADIEAVAAVLRSDWLTTGPTVVQFEQRFAEIVGAEHAVAVSSGTAALHAIMHALKIGPGDEVIVPALTFAATANAVVYQGAKPVFADVDPGTLLLDPALAEAKINDRTRAIVAVDYAGQPCDYGRLRAIADRHGIALVADACHSLGGAYREGRVGTLADASAFSLHPVKHITAGEGGVVSTNNPDLAGRMRTFRSHGITSDHRERERNNSWSYEMVELGFNYRLTDFQSALALNQLGRLNTWVKRRQAIAARYTDAFRALPGLRPLALLPGATHAYHLYVIRLLPQQLRVDRKAVFSALRAEGIGVNVHYLPVHLHPYYQQHFGTGPGLCPAAEEAYESILSLPIFPRMLDQDTADVIAAVVKVVTAYLH